MLLIPAIDLRNGHCVRLYQGDFSAETRYGADPRDLLSRYQSLGATWAHIVDLDGAKDGVLANRPVIASLTSLKAVRLQIGGGVRSEATIDDLLGLGVERVVIGSAAIERPDEATAWLERFGADRVCFAFDVRLNATGEPRVHTRGWTAETSVSLWDAVARFSRPLSSQIDATRIRHVLCTDIERDGALSGPNLDLYQQAVSRFPHVAWQASGGVRNAADLTALSELGVAAAISGKALLEDRITPQELRPFLLDASFPASTFATARS